MFDVREFGARGNDLENDFEAISSAIAAAKNAGGGDVFFPPGVWRSDTTITLPTGVALRGASRDNTILEGFGPASRDGYVTSLIHLSSGTGLHVADVSGGNVQGPPRLRRLPGLGHAHGKRHGVRGPANRRLPLLLQRSPLR